MGAYVIAYACTLFVVVVLLAQRRPARLRRDVGAGAVARRAAVAGRPGGAHAALVVERDAPDVGRARAEQASRDTVDRGRRRPRRADPHHLARRPLVGGHVADLDIGDV